MNLFHELKALLTVRKVVSNEIQEAKQMDGVKPGWKTTEFWIKVCTVDLPLLWGMVHNLIPAQVAAEIELGATAVYTIGRVVVKAVNDVKAARTSQAVAPAR